MGSEFHDSEIAVNQLVLFTRKVLNEDQRFQRDTVPIMWGKQVESGYHDDKSHGSQKYEQNILNKLIKDMKIHVVGH